MIEFNLKFVIIFVLFIFSIPILVACSCGIYNIYSMFLQIEKNTPGEYDPCESEQAI